MPEREWLLWLVTGWRWCVLLPAVAILCFMAGFAIGRL